MVGLRRRCLPACGLIILLLLVGCGFQEPPPPTSLALTSPTLTPAPASEHVLARCVRVVDGDTIEVDIAGRLYKVRYLGIDTPETVHPQEPVEWMGPEATQVNRALVEGRDVYLEKDVSETDKYGRLLRYVYVAAPSGQLVFVNEELVRQGYAQVYTYPPDVRYQGLFLQAQQEAREAERGLWGPREGAATLPPADEPGVLPSLTPVPVLPSPARSPTAWPTPPSSTHTPPTQPASTPLPPPPSELPSTPEPTAPSSPGRVVITSIYYDGQVYRVESDEYVVIENVGGVAVDLAGWRLNAGDPGQDFWFPAFLMQPGQVCRVYTNEDHPEWCGFSFGSGRALWNNDGECGYLFDAAGAEMSRYCY